MKYEQWFNLNKHQLTIDFYVLVYVKGQMEVHQTHFKDKRHIYRHQKKDILYSCVFSYLHSCIFHFLPFSYLIIILCVNVYTDTYAY